MEDFNVVVPEKPVNLEPPYAEYAEAFVEFVSLKYRLKLASELECGDYLRRGLEKLGYSPDAVEYYAYQLDERLMDILDDFLDDYLTGGPEDADDVCRMSPQERPGYDRWQELRCQLPKLKKNLKRN